MDIRHSGIFHREFAIGVLVKRLLVFLVPVILCGCAESESDNSFAQLSPDELAAKSEAGIHGDADAALRVAVYYKFWKYDRTEAIKWMRISAKDGSPMAKHDLGIMLSYSNSASDREEAKKWLAEAAKEGVTSPTK